MKISKRLVELLKKMRVTSAKIVNNKVYVSLEHVPLPTSRVRIVESEPDVGSWYKEASRNVIRIDNDLKRKHWILSLAVHEVVEKFVYNTFFSHFSVDDVYPYPIHVIAEEIEKKWHVKNYGVKSWREYNENVEFVHLKESSRLV